MPYCSSCQTRIKKGRDQCPDCGRPISSAGAGRQGRTAGRPGSGRQSRGLNWLYIVIGLLVVAGAGILWFLVPGKQARDVNKEAGEEVREDVQSVSDGNAEDKSIMLVTPTKAEHFIFKPEHSGIYTIKFTVKKGPPIDVYTFPMEGDVIKNWQKYVGSSGESKIQKIEELSVEDKKKGVMKANLEKKTYVLVLDNSEVGKAKPSGSNFEKYAAKVEVILDKN